MNKKYPSIIAKDGDKVVGYALIVSKEIASKHDLLFDLMNAIDGLKYKNTNLGTVNYILVGQLCVHMSYTGNGLVQKMYNLFKKKYVLIFDYCITDVATDNPRSLKAHVKTGFNILESFKYGGITWNIVLWDWK